MKWAEGGHRGMGGVDEEKGKRGWRGSGGDEWGMKKEGGI